MWLVLFSFIIQQQNNKMYGGACLLSLTTVRSKQIDNELSQTAHYLSSPSLSQ